ncbi:flagellar filament capping protein FliD [Brevibacillus panacihumi]|uniref:flagellar filament capping protein FliD n=1 Tax=Brevibacillus panacihumi TaxID=497735 RepID=UPI003D1FACFC
MPAIRFSGMASGLDTENMVKELMKARREPMNRLIRQKQITEWKRDAYREMNNLLMDLRKSVDSLRFTANFNKKKAVSENTGIASANVVGKPQLSSYAVEVKKLAQTEMPAAVALTVDSSITDTQTKIGSAFDLNINGQTVSVSADDSISSIIDNINRLTNDSDNPTHVQASFVDGKILLTSASGKINDLPNGQFTVSVPDGQDGSKIGIQGGKTVKSSVGQAGQPAEVVINGITYYSNTNRITFDGVEFTFNQKNEGSAITITNQVDEDSVFNSIKDFVNKYNEIIEKINTKISEKKNKGYQPLLDEEREALPDKTAEKMENMSKSGILLRDNILKTGLDEMRRALSTPLIGAGINAAFDTLSEIGIGGPPNGKYAYQENGKLYIDESKLRAAIRNNGEEVTKLFTRFSNDPEDNAATKYQKSGIAERLYSDLTKVIDKVTKEAGSATSVSGYDDSFLGRKMKEDEDEILRWKDRLLQIENRYYKQFAAMETMMSKAQSQSSWFAQMLGQSQ